MGWGKREEFLCLWRKKVVKKKIWGPGPGKNLKFLRGMFFYPRFVKKYFPPVVAAVLMRFFFVFFKGKKPWKKKFFSPPRFGSRPPLNWEPPKKSKRVGG